MSWVTEVNQALDGSMPATKTFQEIIEINLSSEVFQCCLHEFFLEFLCSSFDEFF